MKKTSSFHKTDLGTFGRSLPCDLEGYVHTTARGWMTAPMDGMAWSGYTRTVKLARCKELAAQTRDAIREARTFLDDWRSK